jgi:large subunit ribosomal protein L4
MASIALKKRTGAIAGTIELDDAIFGVQPNVPVMHQVVTAQLANRRSGTQSTKTRAEVSGGGAKPWKQKGTGRARAGSSRSPMWTGGGVALGPKPRSYKQRTPKKMVRLALLSALSDRAAEGNILVVESWGIEVPSTKAAKAVLEAIGATGKALVVVGADEVLAAKSFRNLPNVHVLLNTELNAYDVLCSDVVVFTPATLPTAGANQPVSVATTTAPATPAATEETEA